MGSAPSAALYWGYDLGDMTDPETWDDLKPSWLDNEEYRDWEEIYALAHGWESVPFPDGSPESRDFYSHGWGFKKADEEFRKAYKEFEKTPGYRAWLKAFRAKTEIVKHSVAELATYGSDAEYTYYVFIKESRQSVTDYGDIELEELVTSEDWEWQLKAFMLLLQLPIPKDKNPGWHMCCSYG